MSRRNRILVLSFDPVTQAMAGPAIRSWHLAEVLAARHTVTLASTVAATRSHPAMEVTMLDPPAVEARLEEVDAVVAPTSVVRRYPGLATAPIPLGIDMYIPTHLENLEPGARGTEEHRADVAHQVAVVNEDLGRGDFFCCASERQRDFWLGALASLGRVNPAIYADDPTLRSLVDVVAFGIAATPPGAAGHPLRDHFEPIGPEDPVVVWGGGVYDWFDPFSLVRALDRLRHRFPRIRLVFLGMSNPNPAIPEMHSAKALRALSAELNLSGTHVFFNEQWVPYDQRGAYLLDADIAVSTHLDHLETRFSFRTRVLDYIWAGLPMVLTGGDTLGEMVESRGLGYTVEAGDVEGITDALARLLEGGRPPGDFASAAEDLAWSRVAGPLLHWCEDPRRARDRPSDSATPSPPSLSPPAVVGHGRRLVERGSAALATGLQAWRQHPRRDGEGPHS